MLRIAVEGCCHGALKDIYAAIENQNVELLIICGDFQAVRNKQDLACLACPEKYKQLGDFHLYHNGTLKAPVPTLFIGGNHEAINYQWELYHGGWVCHNIYFLGYAGSVLFGGLRISGLSGIHNEKHAALGYFEATSAWNESTMRSNYHTRHLEIYRLLQLRATPIDIFLSHDWPASVVSCGNVKSLIRNKPYFRREIQTQTLGSPDTPVLLNTLQPRYWFSAHLHVHYEARVMHDDTKKVTEFRALDKCLPNRQFLHILEIEPTSPGPKCLCYDPVWLAVVHKTENVFSFSPLPIQLPSAFETVVTADEIATAHERLEKQGHVALENGYYVIAHDNFISTVLPDVDSIPAPSKIKRQSNPQTEAFCKVTDIENYINTGRIPGQVMKNPEEIEIEDFD